MQTLENINVGYRLQEKSAFLKHSTGKKIKKNKNKNYNHGFINNILRVTCILCTLYVLILLGLQVVTHCNNSSVTFCNL